ncbi:MAG: TVP38/TMEM64 family protein [Nitrospirae bacterium]|nr:TVP38/TMEM64 family protein [Nitrospirota bacterium]
MLHFLDSMGPLAFVGFILLQVAQVVAAPIPGEVTGLLGGYLYGPFLGVALSTIGLTTGSYVAFALSRAFGRPFVERFVNKSTMKRFDYLLHHKGAFLVFLLFLIPGTPKDYLCYILGLGHLTTTEFLVIGGTGRLFGTVLLTLGGNYIRHHQYGRFSILIVIALVVVFIAMAYRDKLERLFRIWHIRDYKKKKAKRTGKRHK